MFHAVDPPKKECTNARLRTTFTDRTIMSSSMFIMIQLSRLVRYLYQVQVGMLGVQQTDCLTFIQKLINENDVTNWQ